MGKIKPIPLEELQVIAGERGLDAETIAKDYYLTALLHLVSKIGGLYFKGGTALYKIYLNHLRLSEDLDFTVKGDIRKVEQEITDAIKGEEIFKKITHGEKETKNYVRLKVHYTSPFGREDEVVIDLNSKAKVALPAEEKEIKHFYKNFIPNFTVQTLALKELVAEKVCAIVQRYAPRDYFDVYHIIKAKLPIDRELLKIKFKEIGQEFDIGRIFKRGNKIYSKWESDLMPLTTDKVTFYEVMETLAEFFNYKEYKEEKKRAKHH